MPHIVIFWLVKVVFIIVFIPHESSFYLDIYHFSQTKFPVFPIERCVHALFVRCQSM